VRLAAQQVGVVTPTPVRAYRTVNGRNGGNGTAEGDAAEEEEEDDDDDELMDGDGDEDDGASRSAGGATGGAGGTLASGSSSSLLGPTPSPTPLSLRARATSRHMHRELLSEDAKRMNHINSEKKRRQNIREAFQTMTELVPSLRGTNYSKATILNKANEYIRSLQQRLGLVDCDGRLVPEEYEGARTYARRNQARRANHPIPPHSTLAYFARPFPSPPRLTTPSSVPIAIARGAGRPPGSGRRPSAPRTAADGRALLPSQGDSADSGSDSAPTTQSSGGGGGGGRAWAPPTLPAEGKMLVVWASLLLLVVQPSGFVSLGGRAAPLLSAATAPAAGRTLLQAADAAAAADALPTAWEVAAPLLWPLAWAAAGLALRWGLLLLSLWWVLTLDTLVHPSSEAFRLARAARRKGEAELFLNREPYFLLALQHLGCPPPTEIGMAMACVWQVGRQVWHMLWVGRAVERRTVQLRGVEASVIELAHTFHDLAHQYTGAGTMPLRAWVALLRALNLAECCGDSDNPLLAELYSAMAFHVFFRLDRVPYFPHRWYGASLHP